MKERHFKIIGHRGACGYAPENTMRSFEKAIDLGAQWVEFDVQFSQDGVPMVLHDSSLARTTILRGRVSRTPSQTMRGGCGKAGDSVPILPEVLDLLAANDVGAYVEIKSCPPGAMPQLLDIMSPDRPDRILSSFHHAWLHEARTLSGAIQIQPLFARVPIKKPIWLDELRPHELGVGFGWVSDRSAKRVLSWGYPVVSYTVNRPEDISKAKAFGLHGVFTDYPDRSS